MKPNGHGIKMCSCLACLILRELQIQSVNAVVRGESIQSPVTAVLISFPFLFYFNPVACRPVVRPRPRDILLYSGRF